MYCLLASSGSDGLSLEASCNTPMIDEESTEYIVVKGSLYTFMPGMHADICDLGLLITTAINKSIADQPPFVQLLLSSKQQ